MRKCYKPIDKLMDCQYVKRWAMVGTDMDSTVASHSFNVAMLAMAIYAEMRDVGESSEKEICFYALTHDVDEAETGDIPTPTKRAAGINFDRLYPTQGLVPSPPPLVGKVVHLADLMENMIFISEHGVGARARVAAADVARRLAAAIDGSPDDMATAARKVMDYVQNRRSDEESERSRIAAFGETRRRMHDTSNLPILGGEPRNSAGGS